MTDDAFTALPPVAEVILIGGESLEITPLKVGELPAFARAVRPFVAKITPDPDWLRLLAEGESVILALSLACRRPPEWVAGLALDDALHLADAVFEANADFFIRRVVPEVTRVSTRIGARIPGATSSNGSSARVTTTPTS